MWNICTRVSNPTILVPIGETVPEGYTVEATTSNPNYLTESLGVEGGRWITKLAFRNRFTGTEKVLVEMAALDDPTAAISARQQAAMLRVYLKDVDNSTYVDLDRADTRAGVLAIEALGLIAGGRALVILDAVIQNHERPSTALLPPGHYQY